MTGSALIRLLSVFARLVGFTGAAFSVGFAVWWTFIFFDTLSSSSSLERWNVGIIPLVMVLQTLIAAWVMWKVFKSNLRSLFLVFSAAFLGSFVVSYGWYFLLLGDGGELMGVGNLLYLLAALLIGVALLVSPADEQPMRNTHTD